MKSAIVFASALASAGSALAAPTETWYSLAASAPNTKIDGVVIGASAESFYISKPSTSSCGDVNPYITVNSAGNMLFYNDGTSNQQQGYVSTLEDGTKGLLRFNKGNSAGDTHLSIAGSEQDQLKVMYDGDANWLACPDNGAAFYIYSAKVQPNPPNKANCIPFEIKATQASKNPEKVCTYQ
ncbi:Cell wall protein [Lasiodiplodia theobromae]|uniref:Cell wall protein n=1 Tax=Lasiodiplodia theobromae TaxID=45133 RepID=UPI0015C2CA27|nr:Cell wall protein [Lasiodiplodia theobromae]KAF4543369.1 Cell wall protein [Lasiodiplodia theobromae]